MQIKLTNFVKLFKALCAHFDCLLCRVILPGSIWVIQSNDIVVKFLESCRNQRSLQTILAHVRKIFQDMQQWNSSAKLLWRKSFLLFAYVRIHSHKLDYSILHHWLISIHKCSYTGTLINHCNFTHETPKNSWKFIASQKSSLVAIMLKNEPITMNIRFASSIRPRSSANGAIRF